MWSEFPSEDWGSCEDWLSCRLFPLMLTRRLLMTWSSCITMLRSSCSLTMAFFTSPRRILTELFPSGSPGRPSVVWKLGQDIEVKWSTFAVENSAQLLPEAGLGCFLADSELSGTRFSRLRLSFSSSSEDTRPLGAKGSWALAILSSSLQETEDCWWDRVQKEGPAKIGCKRWTDFSEEAESGGDMDKVEKEDVPSEVVETKRYKRERKIMQHTNENNS